MHKLTGSNNEPTLQDIEYHLDYIYSKMAKTPVISWLTPKKDDIFSPETNISIKLELFQATGTFKARGAMIVLKLLDEETRSKGVVTASGGNHALATAYAANKFGISSKVVMPKHVSKYRVEQARKYGAEVVLADGVESVFPMARAIEKQEGRYFLHPFDGFGTAIGTGTLGLEFITQVPDLDIVFIPIGGGGLICGMALAIKQVNPKCKVIGVEPNFANVVSISLSEGKPCDLPTATSVADSLCAPLTMPYTLNMIKRYVDDVITVPDEMILSSMATIQEELKLAVEPSAAVSLAGATKLKQEIEGKNVGLLICGSNIDTEKYINTLSSSCLT